MDALIPWTPRHKRKAAIARARRERQASQRSAAEAAQVEAAIERLAAQNHFAYSLAAQIQRRAQGGGSTS